MIEPVLSLGGSEDKRYDRNMTFSRPQLLVVGWNDKLYEFNSDRSEFAAYLVDSVLRGDLEHSNRLFADLFHMYPEFIGR